MRPPYSIKIYGGRDSVAPGKMILHTWHASETSRDTEIDVCRARALRGEISYIEVIDHEGGKTEMMSFAADKR